MNEVEHFTCPHCHKTGVGIYEEATCLVQTPVLGLDQMNSCEQTGDLSLQVDGLEESVTERQDTEYYCQNCCRSLAGSAEALWVILEGLGDLEPEETDKGNE